MLDVRDGGFDVWYKFSLENNDSPHSGLIQTFSGGKNIINPTLFDINQSINIYFKIQAIVVEMNN